MPSFLCALYLYMVARLILRFSEFSRDIEAQEAAREQRGSATV